METTTLTTPSTRLAGYVNARLTEYREQYESACASLADPRLSPAQRHTYQGIVQRALTCLNNVLAHLNRPLVHGPRLLTLDELIAQEWHEQAGDEAVSFAKEEEAYA